MTKTIKSIIMALAAAFIMATSANAFDLKRAEYTEKLSIIDGLGVRYTVYDSVDNDTIYQYCAVSSDKQMESTIYTLYVDSDGYFVSSYFNENGKVERYEIIGNLNSTDVMIFDRKTGKQRKYTARFAPILYGDDVENGDASYGLVLGHICGLYNKRGLKHYSYLEDILTK